MLTAMLGVAAVGIVVFALPLGVAVGRLYKSREMIELEREATRAVGAVPAAGMHGKVAINPPPVANRVTLAYYDERGRLVAGHGSPMGGTEVMRALGGRVTETGTKTLAVAVPIHDEQSIIGVARASEP